MSNSKDIINVEQENEKIYLKKGFFGWKVVYPIRDENGKINTKHLIAGGSWWNLVIVLFIVLMVLGATYEYTIAITSLNECKSNQSNQSSIVFLDNPWGDPPENSGKATDVWGNEHYT